MLSSFLLLIDSRIDHSFPCKSGLKVDGCKCDFISNIVCSDLFLCKLGFDNEIDFHFYKCEE